MRKRVYFDWKEKELIKNIEKKKKQDPYENESVEDLTEMGCYGHPE